MWNIGWHLRGSLALGAGLSDDEVLNCVGALVQRQHKRAELRQEAEALTFSAPLWGEPNASGWPAMAIYDKGRFWIDGSEKGRRLYYDLSSFHAFLFCLAASALFFAIGSIDAGAATGARYALFAFGWLYGVNMLLAWTRIPRAIRKSVR